MTIKYFKQLGPLSLLGKESENRLFHLMEAVGAQKNFHFSDELLIE